MQLAPEYLDLVTQHQEAILGLPRGGSRVVSISASPRLNVNEDRFHRFLVIDYSVNSRRSRKQVWLKYNKDNPVIFAGLSEKLRSLATTSRSVFPAYYFCAQCPLEHAPAIAMEFLPGARLTKCLLVHALVGSTKRLAQPFALLGKSLRSFHDSFPAVGAARPADEIAENAMRLAKEASPTLISDSRGICDHVARARKQLPATCAFPRIQLHHDWILRNMLLDPFNRIRVVDLDSMRFGEDVRWYDVAYFLINLESFTRFRPVLRMPAIEPLWRAFWQGYAGDQTPDGLSQTEVKGLLHMIKVEFLLGGKIRKPLDQLYSGRLGKRYISDLCQSLARGEAYLWE